MLIPGSFIGVNRTIIVDLRWNGTIQRAPWYNTAMKIIRSPRKTFALIVTAQAELVVRAPLRASDQQIQDLVRDKAAWIEAKQKQARARAAESAPPAFKPGELLPYLGQLIPLEIVPAAWPALALQEGRFRLAASAQKDARAVFNRWYRREAARYLAERAQKLAAQHGYPPPEVRISSARTRWGSCSAAGVLRFAWRLVMAPPHVIDYVIVHELAHLNERNHSPRFWARVRAMQPDYPARLQWLKDNGHKLFV